MSFLRHHDGEALASARDGEPDGDFHVQLASETVQARAEGFFVAVRLRPGDLEGHAELAAGDFFFQGLDVGVRFKQKARDTGDHTATISSYDCDSGKSFHLIEYLQQTRPDR